MNNKDTTLFDIKVVLKKWETDFKKNNGKKPSPKDVAGSHIESVYKSYNM